MSELRIGILAEDRTDCDTVAVLVRRLLPLRSPSIKMRSDNGCSTLRRKAHAWTKELAAAGCTAILVVHDLDRNPANGALNDLEKLRTQLRSIASPPSVRQGLCIPVEEIEAWFWSDQTLVRKIGRGKGDASVSPERLPRPKEKLQRLSRDGGGRPRYTTNDNPALAESLDLEACGKRWLFAI